MSGTVAAWLVHSLSLLFSTDDIEAQTGTSAESWRSIDLKEFCTVRRAKSAAVVFLIPNLQCLPISRQCHPQCETQWFSFRTSSDSMCPVSGASRCILWRSLHLLPSEKDNAKIRWTVTKTVSLAFYVISGRCGVDCQFTIFEVSLSPVVIWWNTMQSGVTCHRWRSKCLKDCNPLFVLHTHQTLVE